MPPHTSLTYIERRFLRASYLTLFAAGACLVWSEIGLLRDIEYFGAAVGILLIVAFLVEGRWALSTRAANVLALAIAALTGLWASQQFLSNDSDRLLVSMPWPTSMVPLFGPLLLVLLPAKLFRPKTVADHWGLQGIGLVCAGLGCALTDDGLFGLLLLTYLASVIWCLSLFFLYRERSANHLAEVSRVPRLQQLVKWAAPVLLLALLGFFCLPRSNAVWQVPQQAQRLESGASEESGIDLNRTGTMTLDPEVAFEVFAQDRRDEPKLDLSLDQRWRGPVFRFYYDGSWQRRPPRVGTGPRGVGVAIAPAPPTVVADAVLPDFHREDQYYLTFTIRAKIGTTPPVSDPIFRPSPEMVPVVSLRPDGRVTAWNIENDSSLHPSEAMHLGKTRYRQVTVPAAAPGLGHEVAGERLPRALLSQPPPLSGLAEWTHRLLQRLADSGRLPRDCIEDRDINEQLNPRHHESIAKALEDYLSNSGEYTYSLNLEREDRGLDPTVDFLFNTKSGHCNRFASALAVMLRTLHIPCQVVLGFRGADARGDGWYDVRQCHAHAWVEVLVWREGPRPHHDQHAGRDTWRWLTLDPTPPEAATTAAAASERWWEVSLDPQRMYRDLIVHFSAENRDDFFRDLGNTAVAIWSRFMKHITARTVEGLRFRLVVTLASLCLVAVAAIVLRWVGRRLRRRDPRKPIHRSADFYRRLLTILARRGWKPTPTQTAKEFATCVCSRLADRSDGADLAQVILGTADLYYRVRFGNVPLGAEETTAVQRRLDALARRLVLRGN